MAEESVFRGVLTFFDQIGIYDVVLPFLLIFTIVFALLEKTKVFGVDKVEGREITKKNLNAIVAFVISFLVVASSKLVNVITSISANVVVLMLVIVLFLTLVGTFMKEGDRGFLEGKWNSTFMVIMFIGLVIIFLNAFKTDDGQTWLEFGWEYLINHWSSTGLASVLLIGVIIIVMYFIVGKEETPTKKKET